jgi:hypothetical protein
MLHTLLYESEHDQFVTEVIMYLAGGFISFIISVYIIRAIFNIPTFIKLQKAQMKLLEEIAKSQGVDSAKVQGIISETVGWNDVPTQSVQK